MPSPRTIPSAALPSPQRSDENLVVTAIAVFLLASVVLATAGYQYLQYAQSQKQARADRQAYQRYNDYLQAAQPPEPTPAVAPAPASDAPVAPAQPTMEQKLLSHPAVTPGPGFNAPGVQQTGVAIIEAMDHAQSSAKPLMR